MANAQHEKIAKQGVVAWNEWRADNPDVIPNLNGIDLSKQDWSGANFTRTYFVKANLEGVNFECAKLCGSFDSNGVHIGRSDLVGANLKNAMLKRADFRRANLFDANLSGANLVDADLSETDLTKAKFIKSDLSGANLIRAQVVNTNFERSKLNGCFVYGIATWDLNLKGAEQTNLVITPPESAQITVDNIQVAQFIYLLLNNSEIRNVIDTITSKAVLILGRFSLERKSVLDGIRNKLRGHNYLPIMFDFEKPSSRDLTETITTLAGLSRFIIADLTDAKSIPQELMSIVPNLRSVPVQPIISKDEREYAMFEHFKRFPSVLPIYQYTSMYSLLKSFDNDIISVAEDKVVEIA